MECPGLQGQRAGPDVTTDDGKIYWSYLSEEASGGRPPVHITLTMIDRASGKTLGNASLEIGWGDRDVAVVKA